MSTHSNIVSSHGNKIITRYILDMEPAYIQMCALNETSSFKLHTLKEINELRRPSRHSLRWNCVPWISFCRLLLPSPSRVTPVNSVFRRLRVSSSWRLAPALVWRTARSRFAAFSRRDQSWYGRLSESSGRRNASSKVHIEKSVVASTRSVIVNSE